jgi:hypothetical protein
MGTGIDALLRILERVSDGADTSRAELRQVFWDPGEANALRWNAELERERLLYAAWLELHQWVSDEDIREKDPQYSEMRRDRLRELLKEIRSCAQA